MQPHINWVATITFTVAVFYCLWTQWIKNWYFAAFAAIRLWQIIDSADLPSEDSEVVTHDT